MGMLQIHKEAIDSILPTHEFLSSYQKNKKVVYGFVEGKEDISFYKGFINQVIPEDWSVILWTVGNKDKTIQLYSEFDWNRFPKKQIAFFIDRDLSVFLNENIPNDNNIFITECYAIENHVVTRETCDRVITEICSLYNLSQLNREKILTLFSKEKFAFHQKMIPVMAWIIHWKRSGFKPSLDNIQMKHIFYIKDGKLNQFPRPKNKSDVTEYIHSQCQIPVDKSFDVSTIENEFKDDDLFLRFVRGKYVFWFFIEFVTTIHNDIVNIIPSIKTPPNPRVSFGHGNGFLVVAPYSRIPESLRSFLENTYLSFIANYS